ncbi:hypothetical protein EK21DRAFT_110972 [Setomelanomma holmii]|uniref:Uncharacterized protein n=1 Tax=Setomelanomma holmii TaxID=210430 RepID=A0A9P4HD13_9PLEO|nr:hypothetical protein EK21DRAFT_110972 [Setomelanomma holmii]
MAPTPVVLIGRKPEIATSVRKGLMPEYDVVHVILSDEQGLKDLPLLLSNPPKTPTNTEDNYGSKNYGERPLAVAAGGGLNDEMFNNLRAACKDIEKGIVWLRADIKNVTKMPEFGDSEAYGLETARRVKNKLLELKVGEESTEGKEGVYWFT